MGECWGEGTATFDFRKYLRVLVVLWCKTGRPETVDWDEPEKVGVR
jgi:lipoic acid synthetase